MTYRGKKQVVWPIRGHFGTVFGLRIKANTGYSASLCFLGCPMRPTSSWVKERSSQYLIYLVIISNSQPYNKFLHIEKKTKKKFKISKQKIYMYIFLYIYSNIANQYNSRKCWVDLIHISNLKPLRPSSYFFSRGTRYLQSHLLLGKYMWSQLNKTFFSKTRVTTFLGVFGLWFVQISVKPSTLHSTNISRLYFGIA